MEKIFSIPKPSVEKREPGDKTKEMAELLDTFAKLMTSVSENYSTLKYWETLYQTQNEALAKVLGEHASPLLAVLKQQYKEVAARQKVLREALDAIAIKVRESGQGFAIQGYEERISMLDK